MRSAFVYVMILFLITPGVAVYPISDELSASQLSSLEEYVEWVEDFSSRMKSVPVADRPSLLTVEAKALLKQLERGHPLRIRIILAIRHNASPTDLRERHPDRFDHHLAHKQLRLSWQFLLDLDLLHEGMTLEEAALILGPFQSFCTQPDMTVRWVYRSMMHVNPGLDATIRDGRVVEFKFATV